MPADAPPGTLVTPFPGGCGVYASACSDDDGSPSWDSLAWAVATGGTVGIVVGTTGGWALVAFSSPAALGWSPVALLEAL